MLRDLWAEADVGGGRVLTGGYSAKAVPPHGAVALLLYGGAAQSP